jgi:hypothetical protein
MSCSNCDCGKCSDLRELFLGKRTVRTGGNIACEDCGQEASGKCPAVRTVFPNDQMEARFFGDLQFAAKEITDRPGLRPHHRLILELVMEDNETEQEAFLRLLNKINSLPEEKYEQFSCKHRWVHKPGSRKCMFCYTDGIF